MDTVNTQPRVLKPKKSRVKPLILYGLLVLLIAFLACWVYLHEVGNTQSARSSRLTANINSMKNTQTSCSDGLKKLQPDSSKLNDSSTYNNSAREQALSYLMKCEYLTNNLNQALVYADQLNKLYEQDSNKQQQGQLAQFVQIMKAEQKAKQ